MMTPGHPPGPMGNYQQMSHVSHTHKNVTCHTPNFDFTTPNLYTTKKLSSAIILSFGESRISSHNSPKSVDSPKTFTPQTEQT